MKVKDKVIVVTGGGNGVGRELVLNLLSKGAKVAAVDINEVALAETTALAGVQGSNMKSFAVDITNKEKVKNLLDDIVSEFGQVDGVINNAGIIQPFVKLNELSYDVIDRVLNVNFFGTLFMLKTFIPILEKRTEAHIVNISSMGGFLPVPGQSIYGASKAAIKLLTESLKSEMSNTNVMVTIVFPGAMRTDIMKNSGLKTDVSASKDSRGAKITTAKQAAEIIIDGMEQNKYRIFVGRDAKIMDLIYRLSPVRAANMIYNKMRDKIN